MIVYQRQQKILEYLETKQSATIRELARLLYTSESSVRRDVANLEMNGCVQKTYGGVLLSKYQNQVVPVNLRDGENSSAKDELARRAAKMIRDGDTVIIDASSTTRRIIKYIEHLHNVKIITNNLRIFSECSNPHITLYCTGGTYYHGNHAFIGPSAEAYLRGISADYLFFSSQGITEDGIISDVSEEESSLRRVMIKQSEKQFFLCDSSKIGIRKMFTICNKDELTGVICDKKLPWEKNESAL